MLFRSSKGKVQLLGSGSILRHVREAAEILAKDYGVGSDVYSVTSFTELARDGQDCARWNMLHPLETPRVPYIAQVMNDAPAAAPAAAAAKDVNVPDIGSDEVEVTEILVKVGDKVEAEQSLITVEGDKASMEVTAPFAGTVKEIKVNVGDKVSTGSLIMVFEVAGEAGAAAPAAKQEAAPAAAPAPAAGVKEVNVPDIGGDEVEVTEVMVKVGDKVAAEQSLITVEGDKASMEVPAPFAGVVKELKVNVGDKVKTGSLIMIFEVEGAAPAAAPAKQEAAAPAPAAKAETPAAAPAAKAEGKSEFAENDAYVHATPLIRRLAREFGVNLAKVKGTGRKGRILREDVQAYVKEADRKSVV